MQITPAPTDLSFSHPYRIACGGNEIPMFFANLGGWAIYVYNVVTRKHEWYSWKDDRFYTEIEFAAFNCA